MPFQIRSVCCQRRLHFFAFLNTDVASVKPDVLLLSMQQRRGLADITYVGRRRHQRVDQTRLAVDVDIRLQAELPLVAFLYLVYVWIARTVPVLRRTWRCDQGGVNQRAFAHQQPALDKHRIHLGQHRLRQIIGVKQMAKPHQCCRIRHALLAQVDGYEIA